MAMPEQDTDAVRALRGLEHSSSSVRLRAALAVGTTPDPWFVDKLIARCAIEPEFDVREVLTWALTRHTASMTVPKLIDELRSERALARSAWRAAVVLVPEGEAAELAAVLANTAPARQARDAVEPQPGADRAR